MIITDAFGTSGTNKYFMTLKESGMESFSCIIKVLEYVNIKSSHGQVQEQTHKKYLVTRRIRSKRLLKSVVWKKFISYRLFAQYQAL